MRALASAGDNVVVKTPGDGVVVVVAAEEGVATERAEVVPVAIHYRAPRPQKLIRLPVATDVMETGDGIIDVVV